jgi:hypothetical protein
MAQFLSGRRTNFNVGVTSVTENTTPLQVIGKVGIGTTTADGRSLYVIGNAEVSGIFTASRIFSSTFGEFTGGSISGTNLVGTSLSISGISTLSSLGVTGLTTTKDLLVTNNFQVNGISTLSSLGVTGLTTTRDLLVTNNLQVNGISTLNTISAGGTTGISQYVLTSTGTGLIWQSAIALTGVTGFNVAEDTTNGLKYLGMQIGAGTTQVTTISSNQLVYNSTTKNLGIGTTNATSKLTVSGNVLVSGVVTATNFYGNLVGYADRAGIATYAPNAGIATYAPNAGIATYSPNAGIATYSPNAGIATYSPNAGIATYAPNAGIATNLKGGAGGSIPYQTAADTTALLANGNVGQLLQSNGTTNAPSWASPQGLTIGYANTAGIATYATNAGIATYATNAGIATYAPNAGIATYAPNAGISTSVIGGIASVTSLSVSGASTVGILTAVSIGIGTTNPTSSLWVNGDAYITGILTANRIFSNVYGEFTGGTIIGTNIVGTSLSISGISTLGFITASNAYFTGVVTATTFYGNLNGNANTATYAPNAGIATYAPNAGIATYAVNAGVSTNLLGGAGGSIPYQFSSGITSFVANGSVGQLLQSNGGTSAPSWANPQGLTIGYANTAGIATYATSAGIATYATNAGIATYATNAGIATYATSAGISTYAPNAGIATYAPNAGIATSVIGGIASVTQLSVSGISTLGIASATNLTAQQLNVSGVSTFAGITTHSASLFGTNASFSGVVTATTFIGNLVGYADRAGIATYATSAGIATYATNAGIATYATNAGISTYATNAGISTYATNAGIATNLKGGAGGSIPYQTASDITTFLANGSVGNLLQSNGGTSAPSWASPQGLTIGYANTAGIATYAQSAGIATYATSAGIATYATSAGISTYATSAGIATYATSAGIATYATNAGIATYATNAGIATYATSAGIATYATNAGIATYATNAGIATNLKGGAGGSIPYQTAADTTALLANGGVGNLLQSNGGTSAPSWASPQGLTIGYANTAGISTYATNAGIATIATKLQTPRTFEITGDIVGAAVTFDGTGNVSIAATIQPNSVGLGTDTTGDYVQSITGTSNQISVSVTSGEGSAPTLSIPNQFTAPQDVTVIRDLQVNRNLNVSGNITIGGTSAAIFAQELKISDPDIVLGFRSDAFGNDISNDTTSNHGGVALASTEGTPLVNLFIAGIETNPSTYKKIMWFKSGTFSGLGTDAWLINYAVGIGSTQFPNGTRLAAGNVQFTQNDLAVVRNINSSGIITATQFIGSFSGNVTTATYATNAGIATSVIGGIASVTSLSVSGISTLGTIQISSGIVTATSGIVTYYGDGSKLTGISASSIVGVTTYATSAGIATYATNAGIATYATSAGIATYATSAGIATYATSSGIATYATSAGIATYATSAGIATYATSAGIATYATSAGIATYATSAGIATYATSAGIATYATSAGIATSVIGGIASVTSLSVSGISTLGTVQISSGIVTATSGIVTYYGDGSKLTGITASSIVGVTTYATSAGIATYATSSGIATYATSAGISTYATSAGIATYATSAGIATYATSAGIATYATNAGIATYATSAGIATSVIGGIASVTSLSVSGISTLGTVQISSGIVTATSGIVTYYGDGSKLTGITASSIVGVTTYATSAGIATYATSAGIATYATSAGIATSVIGGIASVTSLSVSGISTLGTVQISSGIVTATSGIVTYYGDGSKLAGITGGLSISTSVTSQSQYLSFVSGASTSVLGISTLSQPLVFTPSTGNLGIGTTNPLQKLHVLGNLLVAAGSSTGQHITQKAYELNNGTLSWEGTAGQLFSITNNLTSGSIFSVNDVSGIPSIDVDANGTVSMVAYGGNVAIGSTGLTGTSNQRLQVTGGAYVSGSVGIGITNPGTGVQLDVVSTTNETIRARNSTISSGYLFFGVSSSDYGRIGYYNGAWKNIAINEGGGNVLIGSVTPTGSGSQPLQVTGSAYVSGSVGIGTTNPLVELQLSPNAAISNVGFGVTLPPPVGSALTVAQFLYSNGNTSRFRIKATRNATGSDWTTASTKLLQVIDSTEMGYVEFNPNGANYGMAFGQGGSEWARFLSTGNFGIGTTNPTEKLQVQGNISINGTTSYGSTNATTATVSQTSIYSGLPSATYRSVEYTIQATQGTNYHATKILTIHNGTLAYNSEYGTIYNNTLVGAFDVDISGGNIRLLVTPASSSSTTYTVNFVATKI